MRILVLLLTTLTGCDVLWREAGEELDADLNDRTLRVTVMPVYVGGSANAFFSDGCTTADNDECSNQTFVSATVTASGALGAASTVGGTILVNAGFDPGGGTLSVAAVASDGQTSTGSAGVQVRMPTEARIAPQCMDAPGTTTGPFLVPADADVRITWDFYDGDKQVDARLPQPPVHAPDLTLVIGGTYHTPAAPGTFEVTSTLGTSSFVLETYVPSPADELVFEIVDDMDPGRDRFTVRGYTLAGGRAPCTGPLKTVQIDTPSVCLLQNPMNRDELVPVVETADSLTLRALAPGTCTVSIAVAGTGQTRAIDLVVDPVPLDQRDWDATCEPTPGTTCGVQCPEFSCRIITGCEPVDGEVMCISSLDESDPACTNKEPLYHFTPYELGCWPAPTP